MGFFDFIGDALGAVASPFTAVIDAGTKLLGLPPVIGDALKIAVGAATGDFVTLMQGSTKLLKDLAGSAAETEYAPPTDEAYGGTDGWAPAASAKASPGTDAPDPVEVSEDVVSTAAASGPPALAAAATDGTADGGTDVEPSGTSDVDPEETRALDTLRRNFDAMNRDHGFLGAFGDKVITEKELRETAEDPDAPLDLKRAARYILDHPDLLERLSRSKDGGDQGIARSDIDLAAEEAGSDVGETSSTGDSGGPAGGDEVSALQTLLVNFDGLNQWTNGLVPPDKVLSRDELERAASDPDTSPALKRALRYVLDHPALLDKLSGSRGFGVQGMSRSDLELGIDDARRAGKTSGSTAKKTASTAPKPATSSVSSATTSKSSSSSSSRSSDPSIKDILNDKSLSLEEKIEMILMVLENRADDQMLSVTQQMDQNDDKKTAKDDRKKVTQLDKVDRDLNFKMERLMKRKEQLSNLLSTMEMKFASMAQTAIANMGR
ncbi:MAG TPA: hypothetical protein VMT11_08910 [Myxococcaceae bacterium]|nr:hypothetical protein [Myxococcaceae bacterium]